MKKFLLLILAFFISLFKSTGPTPLPSPIPTLVPTPTPTPRPLTFSEMNALYGPCVRLSVLMYHHVQDNQKAREKSQTSLTVETIAFQTQMSYLKQKGYQTISLNDLVNFQAIVFLPTGLMDNPGYLSWSQIADAARSGISFGNHTWSHKNVKASREVVEKEISLADVQLAERGLNNLRVFSYPYGLANDYDRQFLEKSGYKLAFTTKSGSTLCKKLRYDLPRVRIGNTEISRYGF